MKERLSRFIDTEREKFDERENNIFALCFSQIIKYYEFLEIILKRYEIANEEFITNSEKLHASYKEGHHLETSTQRELHQKGIELTTALHLEIESFYLFAKILLDKVARALEFCFGQADKLSLDSHDELFKNFSSYAQNKVLDRIPEELSKLTDELKKNISDYRDYQIAHEKSPRTVKGTFYSLDTKKTRMSSNRLYPNPKDEQIHSGTPEEMLDIIDQYLSAMVEYISKNSGRAKLTKKNCQAP